MKALREVMVFRLGHSIPDGAAEIDRLTTKCVEQRLDRERRHD